MITPERKTRLVNELRRLADLVERCDLVTVPEGYGDMMDTLVRVFRATQAGSEPRMGEIVQTVSRFLNVPANRILSNLRTQRVAFARQVAIYLCREMTTLSSPEIGRLISREHATVLHAWRTIRSRVARDPAFAITISKLRIAIAASTTAEPPATTARQEAAA